MKNTILTSGDLDQDNPLHEALSYALPLYYLFAEQHAYAAGFSVYASLLSSIAAEGGMTPLEFRSQMLEMADSYDANFQTLQGMKACAGLEGRA